MAGEAGTRASGEGAATAARAQPAEMARRSLLAYASAQDPGYEAGAPHALIAAALEAVERGEVERLLVLAPPRHGKSRLVSELFPPWWKGLNPGLGLIHATYAQDLADDFGRKVKGLMGTDVHLRLFPRSRVDASSDSVRRFHTVEGGAYYAAGAGGPITGRGGHLLLLDDPYKNRQEADSPAIRKERWEWYQSAFRTRLQNKGKRGAIVVVLTHWHDQDVAGMLLRQAAEGGEQWVVVRLPARAEAGDVLGREIGAPLWPEGGFDDAYLRDMELAVGPREWNALFQQRPSHESGNIFRREWWRWWCAEDCQDATEADGSPHAHSPLPADLRRPAQSWDMAFKGNQTSDFVVGLVGARNRADLYLLDRHKERLDLPGSIAAVRAMTARWPLAAAKYVENKANGPAVVATLKHEIPGMIEVDPSEIGGGKEERWNAAAPYVASGNVWLPRGQRWARDFAECLAAVPATDHDDDADAFAQLVLKLFGARGRAVIVHMAAAVEERRRREAEQKAAGAAR